MASDIISHIVAHLPIVSHMSCDGALEAVVNTVSTSVAGLHIKRHVTVRAVFTKGKCLATMRNLGILHTIDTAAECNGVNTKQLGHTLIVALNLDISG
jgi:hypothetical protein